MVILKDTKSLIWNTNIAYAIGLMTADGNLSSDGRHMTFVSKDLDLIRIFKRCFSLRNKISKKSSGYSKDKNKRYYFVQFGNVRLYNFLKDIGLTPNKSKTIKNLFIPDGYFSDFLRGLIDGDGNIGYFMHPESKLKQFRIRVASGSRDFLEWLNRQINKFLDIRGSIRQVTRAYELCYYKKASKKLVDFIYYKSDIVYLKRKFKIAKLMETREWWNWQTHTV
ncbi:MAG: hypothetical protein KJ706_02935 [Candidatus Omnitrophica bacterium]|nr:hypothetical protein [Candidatus Omnitrophota bacterium]